jgi:predicted dehydrogenase
MAEHVIKLAVIGLGMASKPHLAALKQLSPDIEVAGLYARSGARREAVAQDWGWPTFTSLDEIAQSDVDGAIVITPPNARAEIVGTLAAAGKAVLMEKPVERDLSRATRLVELCESEGVPLGIVFQHRFRAGAKALAALVRSGKTGPVHMVRVTVPWWRPQSYYDQPGRGSYDMDGGGVLLTQAIHVLDLMLSLTDPVSAVIAMTGTTPSHQMEAEDFATAGLRFANGAIGSVVATTSAYPGDAESLMLDCEHTALRLTAGELVINWRDGRTETVGEVTGSGGGGDPMDFPCDWHRDLIADFARAIRHGQAPRITGRDALRVHRLIDAMERSAKSGSVATLEDGI